MTPGNPNIQNIPIEAELSEKLHRALLQGATSKKFCIGMDYSTIEGQILAQRFSENNGITQIHDEICFIDYGPELLSQVQSIADRKPDDVIKQIMEDVRDIIRNHSMTADKMLTMDSLADLKKEYLPCKIEVTKPRQTLKAEDPYIPTYYWIPEFQI